MAKSYRTLYFIRIRQALYRSYNKDMLAYFLLGHGIGILKEHDFQILQGSAFPLLLQQTISEMVVWR